MPQRLSQIIEFLHTALPAGTLKDGAIKSLEESRDDFELLQFKVNKYIKEKEVVIRMLEKNVEETLEQKRELEEINRLVLQKKKEIEKQNSELAAAMQLAEAGIKAKSEFLSTMSHEIRSPLNAIIGMSYILLQDHPKPEQVKNLNILKFSAENLLSLINDILDYSKIESGKIEIESQEFDLKHFIQQLIGMFNVKAQEKNIKLRSVLDSVLPQFVKGDVTRLNQILTNLLANGIKFTDKGSVTLEVTLLERDSYSGRIEFRVTDTGIGIAPEKHQRIFETFRQADNETTQKYGGTGLGLSIIKNLLQLMNSKIELESEPGRGSSFFFVLNFDIPAEDAIAPGRNYNLNPNEFRQLTGFKVLLIEDNEFNIVVARTYLENWGIEVDIAKDGKPGVEKACKQPYDLILLDLQMPNMGGMEAAGLIRKESMNMETPILALSATVTTTIREEVTGAGMSDYLSKPFNPADLHHKLSSYLIAEPGAKVKQMRMA